jgi:tetratricopeptide (TPR) repeat protein
MRKPALLLFILCTVLMLSQTGCLTLIDKKIKDEKYRQALKLENTGKFYMKEGEFDSALECYNKCLPLYLNLESTSTRSKDSLYCSKISYAYEYIAWLYDTLHAPDLSVQNELKAVEWSYKAHERPEYIAQLNYNAGWIYKRMGDKKGIETQEGKEFYKKGIKYILASCWEYDSADYVSNGALWAYYQATQMYGVLGDSTRENFYRKKCSDMDGRYNLLFQDTGKEEKITNTIQKGKYWPKKTVDTVIPNSTSESVTIKNGQYTQTNTVIQNGVKTTITKINGVVVKKETKKLN